MIEQIPSAEINMLVYHWLIYIYSTLKFPLQVFVAVHRYWWHCLVIGRRWRTGFNSHFNMLRYYFVVCLINYLFMPYMIDWLIDWWLVVGGFTHSWHLWTIFKTNSGLYLFWLGDQIMMMRWHRKNPLPEHNALNTRYSWQIKSSPRWDFALFSDAAIANTNM